MAIKITGISSGLEIDEMVKELMEAEKSKLTNIENSKTMLEWKQEKYKSVMKIFSDFINQTRKDFGFTDITSSGQISNNNINSLNWTKTITSTNSSALGISASSSSANGTYKINIKQLASNFATGSESTVNFNKDGANIVDQLELNLTGSTSDAIRFTIKTSKHPEGVEFDYSDLSNVKLEDIINDINSKDLGITVNFDKSINRFFVSTNESGADQYFSVSNGTSIDPNPNFNLFNGPDSLMKLNLDATTEYRGQNAKFDYNGAKDIEMSTNKFALNGINFELKEVTNSEITINVGTNVDGVVDKVMNFVNGYNKLMTEINSITSEKKTNSKPLSEADKEKLTDKEIELYYLNAKKGLASGDLTITTMVNGLRDASVSSVSTAGLPFGKLTDIGIEFASIQNGGNIGLLQIDEAKLREAVTKDAEGVMNLLFKQPDDLDLQIKDESNLTSEQVRAKREQSGIFTKMTDIIARGLSDMVNTYGGNGLENDIRSINGNILINFTVNNKGVSTTSSQYKNYDTRIAEMKAKLQKVEKNYYAMFSRMESALTRMNAQLASMASTFGNAG